MLRGLPANGPVLWLMLKGRLRGRGTGCSQYTKKPDSCTPGSFPTALPSKRGLLYKDIEPGRSKTHIEQTYEKGCDSRLKMKQDSGNEGRVSLLHHRAQRHPPVSCFQNTPSSSRPIPGRLMEFSENLHEHTTDS